MKLPYLQFYTGDWLKDPQLSFCTPATRGVWIDLICAMHESDCSGVLRGTSEQLTRLARCSTAELVHALTDLQNNRAADVLERNGSWTIANRRMVKLAITREKRAAAGSQGGSKTQSRREQNPDSEYEDDNEVVLWGDIPKDLRELAGRLETSEYAAQWHDYVETEIQALGYSTQREVYCVGDFGQGRVDLVVKKDSHTVAIELDNRSPRKKSVAKIKTFDAGMVLLRNPKNQRPEGLDKVLGFCRSNNIPESDGDWFYWKGRGNGWINSGRPIKDWKATLLCWHRAGYLPSQKIHGRNGQNGTPECLKFSYPRDWQEARRICRHLSNCIPKHPEHATQIKERIEMLEAQFKL